MPNDTIIPFQPSTIETVDYAIINWLKERNIHATTNKGFKPVGVQWVTPERAFSVKKSKDSRDSSGALMLPIITVERTGMTKDLGKKGGWYGSIPPHPDHKGGAITITRRIGQNRTAAFAAAEAKYKKGQFNYPRPNKKVVYETITIPTPVYIDVTYKVSIRGEYQQQMNEIVQPFIATSGGINHFVVKHEEHKFEAFMQSDFAQESNVAEIGEEERYYQTTFDIKVLGYLIGGGKNQESPNFVIRENAIEVKIGRERVILGDEITHNAVDKNEVGDDGNYRG